mgnify:CR=1 FL=1
MNLLLSFGWSLSLSPVVLIDSHRMVVFGGLKCRALPQAPPPAYSGAVDEEQPERGNVLQDLASVSSEEETPEIPKDWICPISSEVTCLLNLSLSLSLCVCACACRYKESEWFNM